MLTSALLTYLFDGAAHPLTAPMAAWLAASRRFAAFAATFRNKIRKKLRVTQDPEALLDLHLELETAYRLLQERSLSLVYEPQQTGRTRCPDFAVTYTTHLTFMVEVTRLRAFPMRAAVAASAPPTPSPDDPVTAALAGERLADTICGKLGQLLPQRSNVIVVGLEALDLTRQDLQAVMLRVQRRAEQNDPAFWQRQSFRDRADFFQHYQRLSEVLLRGPHRPAGQPVVVWVNPQARQPLPSKVQTVLYHSHAG